MAEDMVARQGHTQANFTASPNLRYMVPYSMAAGDGSHYIQQARQVSLLREEQQQGSTGCKMGRTPSMQRVASFEHLQKRTRGGGSWNAPSWGGAWEMEGPTMVEQHDI